MWMYFDRVLLPHQIAEATAQGRPRGNLSDLYPRWIGAQELLLGGLDPYSAEVTRKIQIGYYGRPIDPTRPFDPTDQQAFAYPAYVVFLLAPTLHLSFGVIQQAFFWVLILFTLASVPVWLRVVGWKVSPSVRAAIMALTLGSAPILLGLKLQQFTLLVAFICSLAMLFLITERQIAAGVLLALATIKPQLLLPLLLWLVVWSLGDVKRRYRWAVSFLFVMVALYAASEYWLPHWISRFWRATVDYRQYTQAVSVLEDILPRWLGIILETLFAAIIALVCWSNRKYSQASNQFQYTTCLMLAFTSLVMPTFSLYNQVLLLPAILFFARDRKRIWKQNFVSRSLFIVVAALLAWPWISSAALVALSSVSPGVVKQIWALPAWTVPQFPVAVSALMLFHYYQTTFDAPPASPRRRMLGNQPPAQEL
jgi:hypothetical protein